MLNKLNQADLQMEFTKASELKALSNIAPRFLCNMIYYMIYPGKAGFCFFFSLCSVMICANNQIHYGLMVIFICLHITLPHYHHYADVSEGTENVCYVHSVECLSKINSIFSIIFHTICRTMCIQLSHFSYDDCENMCTLSYHYHHQIRSLGLGHETMVRSVCLSILLRYCKAHWWQGYYTDHTLNSYKAHHISPTRETSIVSMLEKSACSEKIQFWLHMP